MSKQGKGALKGQGDISQPSGLAPNGAGLGGLFVGAAYPLRALRLLQRHPQLRPYVIWPLMINLLLGGLLYTSVFWFGLRRLDAYIETYLATLPDWLAFVRYGIQALLLLLLLGVMGLLLLQFGSLLGSPFYGKLSEELEQIKTGQPPTERPLTPLAVLDDLSRAVAFEVKKILLAIAVGSVLLLCNLAPGLGTLVASVGGVALATTIVCLDFLDPPLERRRLRFRTKLQLILQTLPASASFGLLCLGLVSLPLINLLAIPLCITAGTLFFCDRIYRQSA
ncbi:EI24 domain-containing protein [Almyronema epifaneia]|uniref:EI24 domain-containing protein n=1 Tax=Almyronema epifaneia S1 TaxID=2991925 RepID=A0ABW6IBF6_9CYAN